jgi:hypothetical protein
MEDNDVIGYDTTEYVDIDIIDAYDRDNMSDNFTDEDEGEEVVDVEDDKSDVSSSSSYMCTTTTTTIKPKLFNFSNVHTYILQEESDFAAEINIF